MSKFFGLFAIIFLFSYGCSDGRKSKVQMPVLGINEDPFSCNKLPVLDVNENPLSCNKLLYTSKSNGRPALNIIFCDKGMSSYEIQVGLCGLDKNDWHIINYNDEGEMITMYGVKQDMEITYLSEEKSTAYDSQVLGTFPLPACNSFVKFPEFGMECKIRTPKNIPFLKYGIISPAGTAAKAGLVKGLDVALGSVAK
jgi:hypothetical protein